MSTQLIEKADGILSKIEIPDRSTFFQLKNFVVGKEPTIHGQIWATARNLQDRRQSLEMLELQIADGEDALALLDIQAQRLDTQLTIDALAKQEQEIEKRRLQRQKDSVVKNNDKLKLKMKYLLEEVGYFVQAFETLTAAAGGFKSFDDPEALRNFWNEKLTEELNLCLLLKRPVNTELVQVIMSLEDEMPIKKQMVQILQKVQSEMIEERDRQLSLKAQARIEK